VRDYNNSSKQQPLLYIFMVFTLISWAFSSEERKNYGIAINDFSYEDQSELTISIEQGNEIYANLCVTCHRPDGQGVKGSFPPLAGSDYLMNHRTESIRAVKYGQQGAIVVNGITYDGVMAPLGLNDEEIADVLNYVMNSWDNKQDKMITIKEVAAVRK